MSETIAQRGFAVLNSTSEDINHELDALRHHQDVDGSRIAVVGHIAEISRLTPVRDARDLRAMVSLGWGGTGSHSLGEFGDRLLIVSPSPDEAPTGSTILTGGDLTDSDLERPQHAFGLIEAITAFLRSRLGRA